MKKIIFSPAILPVSMLGFVQPYCSSGTGNLLIYTIQSANFSYAAVDITGNSYPEKENFILKQLFMSFIYLSFYLVATFSLLISFILYHTV